MGAISREMQLPGSQSLAGKEVGEQVNMPVPVRLRDLQSMDHKKVDWSTVERTHWVDGKQGGVVVVEFPGSSALCIKPRDEHSSAELVAEHLAKAIGVRTPNGRTLGPRHAEHEEMVRALLSAPPAEQGQDGGLCFALTGIAANRGMLSTTPTEWKREFLSVQEFVPGRGLVGPDAEEVFADLGKEQLWSLGRIMAMDIVLNNAERFALPMWTDCGVEGTLARVMVPVDAKALVGINQRVNSIGPGLERSRYQSKVQDFLEDLTSKDEGRVQVVKSVAVALNSCCHNGPSEEQAESILEGLLSTMKTIGSLLQADGTGGKKGLASVLERSRVAARRSFSGATTDVGRADLDQCLDFVEAMAEVIEETVNGSDFDSQLGFCGANSSGRPLSVIF